MLKKTLLNPLVLFLIVLAAIPLIPTALLYYHTRPYEVGFAPKYAEIYQQTFEAQEDLFLDAYRSENTPDKIEKGTKIRITKILEEQRPFVGINVYVLGEIVDSPVAYPAIDLTQFIHAYWGLGYSKELAQFDPRDLKNTEIRNLHTAVRYRDLEAVIRLVENGANLNQTNLEGKTALHYAKDLAIARYLLEKGAPIQLPDASGRTILHYAVQYNHFDLVKLLIEQGAYLDSQDKEGDTPLLLAADAEHFDMVAFLLTAGADATLKGKYDNTVLLYAAHHDRLDIVELCLKFGADPLAICSLTHMSGLLFAARNGNIAMTQRFLEAGAPINSANDSGTTALHYAVHNLPLLAFLIQNGADVHLKDKREKTVLDLAADIEDEEVVNFLKQNRSGI